MRAPRLTWASALLYGSAVLAGALAALLFTEPILRALIGP